MLVEGRSAFVNIYDFKDGEGALQVLNTDPGPLQCAALFRSRHTQLYPPALSFLGYPGRLHGLICGLSVAEVCSSCCPSFPLEAGELVLIYAGEKPYTLYTEEDLQKFPVIRVEPEYEIPYLFYDLLYVAYLVFDCYISSGLDGAAIQGNSLLEQMFSTVCAYEGEALTPTKRNADMFLFTGVPAEKDLLFCGGRFDRRFLTCDVHRDIPYLWRTSWNISPFFWLCGSTTVLLSLWKSAVHMHFPRCRRRLGWIISCAGRCGRAERSFLKVYI